MITEAPDVQAFDISCVVPDPVTDKSWWPPRVLYMEFETELGVFLVASTQEGVVRLLLPSEPREKFFDWLYRVFGSQNVMEQPLPFQRRAFLESDDDTGGTPAFWNREAAREIKEYLAGQRRRFSVKLELYGTPFRKAVWRKVQEIPYGATATYAQVAEAIGKPRAVRAVGAANGANPVPIIIPCHRVIGSSGSLVGYGGGIELKRYLLELEARFLLPH